MVIKSKYFFSNNCYNDLVKLISDILSKPHKVPKDMYQSKKMMYALGLKYEKIGTYPDNYMLFWKEHANEKKCLGCGQSRFIKVVTRDGEKGDDESRTKAALLLSNHTLFKVVDMWHKEGIRENDGVMRHPSDGEAWKVLNRFDADFTSDARNIRFGLATDGFDPFSTNSTPYFCWPIFVVPYNLPPYLCMKFEFMFLCLIVPDPKAPGPRINVILKPLI
jgi:hypothetical protein